MIDVYLGGTVSELAMKRAEYTSVLERDGFDALVSALERKIADASGRRARQLRLPRQVIRGAERCVEVDRLLAQRVERLIALGARGDSVAGSHHDLPGAGKQIGLRREEEVDQIADRVAPGARAEHGKHQVGSARRPITV